MSDRAMVIFVSPETQSVSPIVRSYWLGEKMQIFFDQLKALMGEIQGLPGLYSARFTYMLCVDSQDNSTGINLANCPPEIREAALALQRDDLDDRIHNQHVLTLLEASEGGAGLIVYNCDTDQHEAFGGYFHREAVTQL